MLSRPVMYWFGGTSGGERDLSQYLEGNALDRNLHIFLICAGLIVLVRRHADWATISRQCAVVSLFYAYILLSVIWSDYPLVSFKRVVREFGTLLMTLLILTDPYSAEATRRLFVRCTVVLVPLSALAVKYYPSIGRYYHRWTDQVQYAGVTSNKNSLGVLAMLGGMFLLWHIAETSKGRTPWRKVASVAPESVVVLLCLWLLSIANSATAVACFALGAVVYIAGRLALGGLGVGWTTGALVLVGAGGWLALWSSALRAWVAESLGRDSTLTTRTDIWAAVLGLPTNGLLGAGFASVWLTPAGWALRETLKIPHAHNGYLETYLNGGAVGVVLLLGVLLLAVRRAAQQLSDNTPAGPFYVALVLVGLIYNFSEAAFNNSNAVGVVVFLVALSGASYGIGRLGARPSAQTSNTRGNGTVLTGRRKRRLRRPGSSLLSTSRISTGDANKSAHSDR